MAGNTKAIKAKLGTTSNLKKITRAMEMVARSKSKRSIDAALSTRSYATLALEIMSRIKGNTESVSPLLQKKSPQDIQNGKVLLIHIASNKGLCGAYNTLLFKSIRSFFGNQIKENDFKDKVDVIAIGKYAGRHCGKIGAYTKEVIENLREVVTREEVTPIVDEIIDLFSRNQYHTVFISYTQFENVFSLKPTIKQLLPVSISNVVSTIEEINKDYEGDIDTNIQKTDPTDYVFEPGPQEVLKQLLPKLVTVQLFQSLLEANASEQAARMVAMKSATDNASKFEAQLLLQYNRARQASITTELTEIVAGAEAVSG